jgi:hypothetical protein
MVLRRIFKKPKIATARKCFQYIGHEFVWNIFVAASLWNIGHYVVFGIVLGLSLSESKGKRLFLADNKFMLKYAIASLLGCVD